MRFILLLVLSLVNPAVNAESFLDRLPGLGGNEQPVFLPPDQAFGMQLDAADAHTLVARFNVASGYYLYKSKIIFTSQDGTTKIKTVNLPTGEMRHDANFGDQEVFHKPFQAEILLDRSTNAAGDATFNATYQGCSEQGLCYPPVNQAIKISLPAAGVGLPAATPSETATALSTAAPVSENSKIAQLLNSGNFWLVISFFFVAGLLLAFTPCVFPMIPILSGIIVGRGEKITKMHAFMLSLVYVLGMAITYAAAGVAAGYSGFLISSALQTPWVLGSFAAVFVLLSLSMFGFYELQLPNALQSKLANTSNRLHGGHLGGVFIMGALSAIIVSPCVAAPLAGALLYIGQTHDAALGGAALFALALGMGAPLLLIGTSAGALLPKAGAWMEAVKRFFGVLLLALAIWIIQPLLPISVQMLLWAALLLFCGIYLRALDALPQNANGRHKLTKSTGVLALLFGIAYLVGALSGAHDMLRPLGNIGGNAAQPSTSLQFARVKNLAELEQRLSQAQGQMVMLDFYADWCVACKEMERYTFSDPLVQEKLKPVLLLQADVTANSAADQALLKRYILFGPPAILFFNAQKQEMSDFRVTGYQDSKQFLQTLQSVGL